MRALALSVVPGANLANFPPEELCAPRAAKSSVRPGLATPAWTGKARHEDRGLPAARQATNVGGMAAYWSCACPEPAGTERIPLIETTDWDEAFQTAQRYLSVQSGRGTLVGATIVKRLAREFAGDVATGRPVGPLPLAYVPQTAERQSLVVRPADTVLGPLAGGRVDGQRVVLVCDTACRRVLLSDDIVRPRGRARGSYLWRPQDRHSKVHRPHV